MTAQGISASTCATIWQQFSMEQQRPVIQMLAHLAVKYLAIQASQPTTEAARGHTLA